MWVRVFVGFEGRSIPLNSHESEMIMLNMMMGYAQKFKNAWCGLGSYGVEERKQTLQVPQMKEDYDDGY